MGLLKQTEKQYYSGIRTFTGDGTTNKFTISTDFETFPPATLTCSDCVKLYRDGVDFPQTKVDSNGVTTINWQFLWDTIDYWHFDFTLGTTPTAIEAFEAVIETGIKEGLGDYQYITISDVINNFMISNVGEGKLISKVRRSDVLFHAQRTLQELSYDTLRSVKSQEIEVPASLTMMLPHDYVGYVKVVWSDASGIEHIIYPARKTSNPTAIKQDTDGDYSFDFDGDGFEDTSSLIHPAKSDTWDKYKGATPSENQDYDDNTYSENMGKRYGLDPQHAQANGSFFIDQLKGLIHFSSNISGKTVILKYLSDGLGTKVNCYYETVSTAGSTAWVVTMDDFCATIYSQWASQGSNFYSPGGLYYPGQVVAYADPVNGGTINYFMASTQSGIITGATSTSPQSYPAPVAPNVCCYGQGCVCPPSAMGTYYWEGCDINIPRQTTKPVLICDDDVEPILHKFAEEAAYKHIAYAVLSTKANIPEYIVNRYKKERFAETRKAKLRLSDYKLEELTQILRGRSKWIKH